MENTMEEIEQATTTVIPFEDNTTLVSHDFELTEPQEVEGKASARGRKINVSHILRNPSLTELQKRDASRPYRSRDIGNEEEEVLVDATAKADVKLYDALVVETKGYKLNIEKDQTPEARQQALSKIPSSHKRSVIKDITEMDSKAVYDNNEEEVETFDWSETQTYRIRTEIGSRAQFTIYTNIKEPSELQLEVYTGATKFVLEKGSRKPVTKITVDLASAVKLFDELIQGIEGFTYKGNIVDVQNAEQLASINGYFKRSVIDAVVRETQLDLGE